jgi:hypothetical protein
MDLLHHRHRPASGSGSVTGAIPSKPSILVVDDSSDSREMLAKLANALTQISSKGLAAFDA